MKYYRLVLAISEERPKVAKHLIAYCNYRLKRLNPDKSLTSDALTLFKFAMANLDPCNIIKLLQDSGVFPEHQQSHMNNNDTMLVKNCCIELQKGDILLDTPADRIELRKPTPHGKSVEFDFDLGITGQSYQADDDDVAALSEQLIL